METDRCSGLQLASHLAELSRQVQANEPDTLIYYAFSMNNGGEIMVVERYLSLDTARQWHELTGDRYRDHDALQIHLLGPYFQEFGEKASGLMERPYDVKVGTGVLDGSSSVLRI